VTWCCPFCLAELEDDIGGMRCPEEQMFIPDEVLAEYERADTQ
jgi:hypothetical protein